ncbi:hypothetical protein N7540_005431 [Penicillium herquei]|nr:hypothetical protein N7540_005431 [Penicillium herquei]
MTQIGLYCPSGLQRMLASDLPWIWPGIASCVVGVYSNIQNSHTEQSPVKSFTIIVITKSHDNLIRISILISLSSNVLRLVNSVRLYHMQSDSLYRPAPVYHRVTPRYVSVRQVRFRLDASWRTLDLRLIDNKGIGISNRAGAKGKRSGTTLADDCDGFGQFLRKATGWKRKNEGINYEWEWNKATDVHFLLG